MNPDLFWIPGPWKGRLAISKRPRGGDWLEDEVRGWKRAGVQLVASLLESAEERQLEITDEGPAANRSGIEFVSFPIPDRGVPASVDAAVATLDRLSQALESGRNVAVHCRQGIGRSALIAAGLLIASGVRPADAIETVQTARGMEVPETAAQRAWLLSALADSIAQAHR
jgi:protein-tyrosine phosphatase